MKLLITCVVLISLAIVSSIPCGSTKSDCEKLPGTWYDSYDEAIQAIVSKRFEIEDSVNITNGEYIDFAQFRSCRGGVGYLCVSFKRRNINLLGRVPFEVWNKLKMSDDKEKFYEIKIKFNYPGVIVTVQNIELRKEKFYLE